MKKVVSAAALLLVTMLPCFAQEHQEHRELGGWIKYSSPEGRYSILMPSEPTLSTQDSVSATGVKFPQYLASAAGATEACIVGYFDHVAGTTFSFDKARDGFVGAVRGTLISENSISLGGYPGRDFRVSGRGADDSLFSMRVRIYDINNRVYVVQFIVPSSADNEPGVVRDAKRYFDSFLVTTTP